MDLRLPILFVIPKSLDYSFLQEDFKSGEKREAFFMGLGDAVMPTLLVVSANVFMKNNFYPIVGAILGTLVGARNPFHPGYERKTAGRASLFEFRGNPGVLYWCSAIGSLSNVKLTFFTNFIL